jgi:protein-tyrosine-phosphatase
MAELLLARTLDQQGALARIELTSAGIEATLGLPATTSARRAVQRRLGHDLMAHHKASLLTAGLMGQTDLIIVMTRGQKAHLLHEWDRVIDGLGSKLYTLGEYAGRPEVDVDDPVGRPDERYDACLALLEELTGAAARRLMAETE